MCVLFFVDMTEDNILQEEINVSDAGVKRKSSTGENSSDENLNEELDFYDFLEAVSDKIDTITDQSKLKNCLFVYKLNFFS